MDRQAVFDYVKKQYGTEPEYLWMKYPSYAVLRRRDNEKWYGIVMDVPENKLGLSGAETVEILDVKCEPQIPGFFPGYHMNKKNWVSILLDGTVPENQILDLLDQSFRMTGKKQKGTR